MKVVKKKKRMVIRRCRKQFNFKLNFNNVCQLYYTNKTHWQVIPNWNSLLVNYKLSGSSLEALWELVAVAGMVLMNLQDISQTGIKVAHRECRVTAIQVCGLNPAGWSILWMHGYASASMQIAIFVFCYSTMWSNKTFLWCLSKQNNCVEIHYHYPMLC